MSAAEEAAAALRTERHQPVNLDSAPLVRSSNVTSIFLNRIDPRGKSFTSLGGAAMSEPASTAAGGIALWKFAAGAGAGAALAMLIVMCMTPPRTVREWTVGLVSTVIGSVCGGAAVIQHFGLQSWFGSYVGLVAVLGLAFVCGLPAWALVRMVFNYLIARRDKDLLEVVDEAKKVVL